MKTNIPKVYHTTTHEGGQATPHQTALQELERAVSTCLLFESTFYEKGSAIAARIAQLCTEVSLAEIAALAVKARNELKLRHVPLFLAVQLARRNSAVVHGGPCPFCVGRLGRVVTTCEDCQGVGRLRIASGDALVARTITEVVQRPDEISEFLSLYWQEKRQPLAGQVKKGLARAFQKFSPYQLAKWNRPATIKLRDVLFLVHAKPKDEAQAADWKALVEGTLAPADTWETALSAGADKTATWERLITERKLGYMALLMNLRNMEAAKVNSVLVRAAILGRAEKSRALPFRLLSAAKAAPMYADVLSEAMGLAVTDRLPGRTVVLVDVSGSMEKSISAKSQLMRWEAGAALAVLLREMTPACRIFTFSQHLKEVMNVKGIPLIMGIGESQPHLGTYLATALTRLKGLVPECDRVVVITDEQTADGIIVPWAPRGYLLNVAPYQPGLETAGGWVRINGWSEAVVRWMAVHEGQVLAAAEDEE